MQCAEVPDETQTCTDQKLSGREISKDTGRAGIRKKPELIAGFVLRVGDIEEDFSIRGRLDRLQQKLTWR
ncbi:MAG: F0F1 ATP synthase subunit delta [Roseburia inulinivorans]